MRKEQDKQKLPKLKKDKIKDWIHELENKMQIATESLDFEAAAEFRDEIEMLKEQL
jgi:excinuclease UvrABC nuclease subunit